MREGDVDTWSAKQYSNRPTSNQSWHDGISAILAGLVHDNDVMCCSREKDGRSMIRVRSSRESWSLQSNILAHGRDKRGISSNANPQDIKRFLRDENATNFATAHAIATKKHNEQRLKPGHENSKDQSPEAMDGFTRSSSSSSVNSTRLQDPKPLPNWTAEEQRALIDALRDEERKADNRRSAQNWEERVLQLAWKFPKRTAQECLECARHFRASKIAYFGERNPAERVQVDKGPNERKLNDNTEQVVKRAPPRSILRAAT